MTNETQILIPRETGTREKSKLRPISDFELMTAQRYRQLEEIKTKNQYITRVELEVRLSQFHTDLVEALKDEFDRRDEFDLELIRQIVREEIQKSSANNKEILIEDIEFDKARELVINYLKENKIASLSDLSETFKIDLCMLCDIIGELKENGLIKERDE